MIQQESMEIINTEVHIGYMKTKNGIFPDDWKVRKIKDILKRVRKPVDVQPNQGYKQIGIRSHGKGIFYKETVSGEELGNKAVFWIEPDCFIVNIVFAWEMAVAKTTKKELGYIASHRFPMYKPKKDMLDLDYITYLFMSPRGKYLLNLASPGGAGRNKTLGQKEFGELEVVIPQNVKEQNKISEILLTWDKAIGLKKQMIKQKKEQKKGIMQNLLTGEVRLPGFDGKWEENKIKDIADIYLGLTYTPEYVKEGVPFLSVKDLSNNNLNFENTKYISRSEFEKSTSNAKPKKGDVLFGRVGTIGNPVILNEDTEFSIFVSLGFLRIRSENILNYFVKYWMESALFTRQVDVKIAGSSQKNLNTGWLKEFHIRIPKIEEQKSIVKILFEIDKEINLLEKEQQLLIQQRKGLMQLLLTGKVRVKV
ncbi:hypothetical protein M948_10235 [Virgibacillus sp. CM-4]|uniref:restriction endonuclease subunit S n=1 Tax=Virgibacillus sp. CM-4 TaxID=1354277 RepID=UPI0003882C49|nr:restriction endonuclease subunit S [Virgibacillus sp. CM-4]EQB37047.1 hypothetical protein M948_10235 [Virgibacillus sp. CM-4]